MRRAAIASLLLGVMISACAGPRFDLSPRFLAGEVRVYRLQADATVRISAGQASTSERSQLNATATIKVEDLSAGVTTVTLTVTARSLRRDGKAAPVPPPQEIRMTISPEGRVTQVTSTGSQPTSLETADVEDLVPLIGPPLPPGRVHLGDRWTQTTQPTPSGTPSPSPVATIAARQESRLAAARVVGDYDCVVVAVSTRRPVVRERVVGGTPLRLEGLEFAASEIAFAFHEGLPITVGSDSEARLGISGGGAQGGLVVITTKTTLTLVRRSAPGLR